MAVEMGLWRAEGGQLTRIVPVSIGLESQLEGYIESDPSVLGEPLLVIGRQVPTAHGGFVDLLALDARGSLHVIELKRDKTPRDVAAQTLDYGSWAATLGRSEIDHIFATYRPGLALEEAFAERFGDTLPEEVNTSQEFRIVAASVDNATERIVRFLNENFDVPINVVFFRHFQDNGSSYLARSWLVDQSEQGKSSVTAVSRKNKTREPWNGSDWYVSFGEYPDGRQWVDGMKYGFISGGGGKVYSQTLRTVPIGARVFAYIPKIGYVGVGTVVGEAQRYDKSTLIVNGAERRLRELDLSGNYRHEGDEDDDNAEWVLPVDWIRAVPQAQAVRKAGLFANPNTATRLRSQFTIENVTAAFGLDD